MIPITVNPTNSSTTTGAGDDGGFQRLNTPIPYLLCGLALVMGVIALALALLACSYRINSSFFSASSETSNDKAVPAFSPEMEARIVIMPGETNPTHLARPAAATTAPPVDGV